MKNNRKKQYEKECGCKEWNGEEIVFKEGDLKDE